MSQLRVHGSQSAPQIGGNVDSRLKYIKECKDQQISLNWILLLRLTFQINFLGARKV